MGNQSCREDGDAVGKLRGLLYACRFVIRVETLLGIRILESFEVQENIEIRVAFVNAA